MPTYEVKLTFIARNSKDLADFSTYLDDLTKPEEDTGQSDCVTHRRIDSVTELQPMHVEVRLPPELQALVDAGGGEPVDR